MTHVTLYVHLCKFNFNINRSEAEIQHLMILITLSGKSSYNQSIKKLVKIMLLVQILFNFMCVTHVTVEWTWELRWLTYLHKSAVWLLTARQHSCKKKAAGQAKFTSWDIVKLLCSYYYIDTDEQLPWLHAWLLHKLNAYRITRILKIHLTYLTTKLKQL